MFPVECLLPYKPEDPSTHVVRQSIFKLGAIEYKPRPSDGRRIFDFPTQEMQKEAIGKNPRLFVIPTDVVSAEMEGNIRRVVDARLTELGLLKPPPATTPRSQATSQAIALARELGLDLGTIQGTGPGGQVTKVDVERVTQKAA